MADELREQLARALYRRAYGIEAGGPDDVWELVAAEVRAYHLAGADNIIRIATDIGWALAPRKPTETK